MSKLGEVRGEDTCLCMHPQKRPSKPAYNEVHLLVCCPVLRTYLTLVTCTSPDPDRPSLTTTVMDTRRGHRILGTGGEAGERILVILLPLKFTHLLRQVVPTL